MSFVLEISPKSGKKYRITTPNNKKIDFGAKGYEDYTIHKDPERKKRYISRHQARENWSDTNTAGFWSRWILWNLPNLKNSIKDTEKRFNIKIKNTLNKNMGGRRKYHTYGSHHAKRTLVHAKLPAKSKVRAIHNVAKGPKVNVVVDGNAVLEGVGYKAVSDYLKVPSGMHNVSIETEDGTTLASADVNLEPNKDYTVIAHGDVKNLRSIALLALQDDNSCPTRNKSHVRFVHAAAKAPAVDIWVNNQTKVFQNVSYGSTGNPTYLPVDSGDLNISVTPSNTTDIVLGPIPLTLESGKTYSIIASGLVGDDKAPLTAIISEDNSCPTVNMM